ncbi:hypothetical protein QX215_20325 [Chryseobacterium gambrini]|nr:hypothetical protein [Chryseobacterium gambrini]
MFGSSSDRLRKNGIFSEGFPNNSRRIPEEFYESISASLYASASLSVLQCYTILNKSLSINHHRALSEAEANIILNNHPQNCLQSQRRKIFNIKVV